MTYVRHGTTNLFAALNVATGEVFGECKPTRDGADFLAFLKKAVKPHAGADVHVVLDNLSTHTTPEVKAWLERNPHLHFHFTPVGSSWINQIETWFGIITRQSIRRGTFTSVTVLIKQIRDYSTIRALVAIAADTSELVTIARSTLDDRPSTPPAQPTPRSVRST